MHLPELPEISGSTVVSFVSLALVDTPPSPTRAQWIAFSVQTLALALLAAFAIYCLVRLKNAMDEKTICVETSWGGLGGSLGGWSISRSLTWFIATMLAVFFFFVLALYVPSTLTPAEQNQGDQKKKSADKQDDNQDAGKHEPASGSAADQSKGGDNNPPAGAKPSASPTPK